LSKIKKIYFNFKKLKYIFILFFKYFPFFLFFKKFISKLYFAYFSNNKNSILINDYFNIFFIIRKSTDITANLLMYFVIGKILNFYKLPKILYIVNNIFKRYLKKKIFKGYKILCAGRFSRKDRAYYV